MKTLVLIATYNERDNIIRLLKKILVYLPNADILVVDDNSPDGTSDVARKAFSGIKRIHIMTRMTDKGYGKAMLAGFHYAIDHGYTKLLTLDADFSHDPADLPRV